MRSPGGHWRRSRLACVLIAVIALITAAGCSDSNQATGPTTTTTTSTTTTPTISSTDVSNALAEIRETYNSTPQQIATDLAFWGARTVTPAEVHFLATQLCTSGFNPNVTTNWLQSKSIRGNFMLIGPSNRLLRLAGFPATCTRPPSAVERTTYTNAISSSLAANNPLVAQQPSSVGEKEICDALGTDAFGAGAELSINALLEKLAAGRPSAGRYELASDLLPYVLGAVTGTCESWLPKVRAKLGL